MARKQPQNIVVVVADSLRYESVFRPGAKLAPYLDAHGVKFTQARSGGCWTLPATASMFMGLLPHEHGATSQTREVTQNRPTIAELLHDRGYGTVQITNNVVTTEIFGLHRGFDSVEKFWRQIDVRMTWLWAAIIVGGKPRLRERMWRGDWINLMLSEDVEQGKNWVTSPVGQQLDRARQVIAEHRAQKKPLFLFVNLMDTHFPYQFEQEFAFLEPGLLNHIREFRALLHMINQTRYLREQSPIAAKWLDVMRRRQWGSWDRIAPFVDDFARELHEREDEDNTVVFCADHGENFGEDGWEYHFSNVTDAGNRVPLYWLRAGDREGRTVTDTVSMRDMYGSLCVEGGIGPEQAGADVFHLVDAPERSLSVTQSYWYNNRGRTRPEYRFNQFSFVDDTTRYVHRKGGWSAHPRTEAIGEGDLQPFGADPIRDNTLPTVKKAQIGEAWAGYEAFSARVMAKGPGVER